jgi:hypothetical protein
VPLSKKLSTLPPSETVPLPLLEVLAKTPVPLVMSYANAAPDPPPEPHCTLLRVSVNELLPVESVSVALPVPPQLKLKLCVPLLIGVLPLLEGPPLVIDPEPKKVEPLLPVETGAYS